MVLPKELNLAGYMGDKPCTPQPLWHVKPAEEDGNGYGGIGYSRLCIQVVGYLLGLDFVWVIDDNVTETRELDLGYLDEHRMHSRERPKLCKFWEPMRHIESLVEIGAGALGQDLKLEREAELGNLGTAWQPFPGGQAGSVASASNLQRYVGDSCKWGIVGMHRQWSQWKSIQKPFLETHSVYSFFLLNVRDTVEEKLLYAAKPIWEDIDFSYDLLHNGFHVIKVNRWFHRKLNRQQLNKAAGGQDGEDDEDDEEDEDEEREMAGAAEEGGLFCWPFPEENDVGRGIKLEVQGLEPSNDGVEDVDGRRRMLQALSQCVSESTGASRRVPFVSSKASWVAFEAHLYAPDPVAFHVPPAKMDAERKKDDALKHVFFWKGLDEISDTESLSDLQVRPLLLFTRWSAKFLFSQN